MYQNITFKLIKKRFYGFLKTGFMLIASLLEAKLHTEFFKRPQATKHPSKALQKFNLSEDFQFNKHRFLHFVLPK